MTVDAEETEVYGVSTQCICPKCHKKHIVKLKWIGRGTPRKFCQACKFHIDEHETAQIGAVTGASHAFGWSLRVATR